MNPHASTKRVRFHSDAEINVGSITGTASQNLTQLNSNAISLGAGATAAGTQRVTIASDDVPLTSIDSKLATMQTNSNNFDAIQYTDGVSGPITDGLLIGGTQTSGGGTFRAMLVDGGGRPQCEIDRVGNTNVTTNAGPSAAGCMRVCVANDQVQLASISTNTAGSSANTSLISTNTTDIPNLISNPGVTLSSRVCMMGAYDTIGLTSRRVACDSAGVVSVRESSALSALNHAKYASYIQDVIGSLVVYYSYRFSHELGDMNHANQVFEEINSGSADVTYTTGLGTILKTTGTTINSTAELRKVGPCIAPGWNLYQWSLVSNNLTGTITCDLGVYQDSGRNTTGFVLSASDWSVSNAAGTTTASASWNIDPLDGTGPSGISSFTVNSNNAFWILTQPSSTAVIYGIVGSDGRYWPVHASTWPSQTKSQEQNLGQPFIKIDNGASGTNGNDIIYLEEFTHLGQAQVSLYGVGFTETSITSGNAALSVAATTSLDCFAFGYLDASYTQTFTLMSPQRLSISSDGATVFLVELIWASAREAFNPLTGGAATNSHGNLLRSTNAASDWGAITNPRRVLCTSSKGNISMDIRKYCWEGMLGVDSGGNRDWLVVNIYNTDSSAHNYWATLSCLEF